MNYKFPSICAAFTAIVVQAVIWTSHADDIIWSTANSSVILTQGDAVFQNERLIIEPGVTVEGNGHKIQVFGELQGIGASAAPIFLNNVVIRGSQALTTMPKA